MREAEREKALLGAVLERAILDFLDITKYTLGKTSIHHNEQEKAEKWLFKSKCKEPFTFIWICEVLELDVGRIRTSLVKVKNSGESFKGSHLSIEGFMRRIEHVYTSANDGEIYIC